MLGRDLVSYVIAFLSQSLGTLVKFLVCQAMLDACVLPNRKRLARWTTDEIHATNEKAPFSVHLHRPRRRSSSTITQSVSFTKNQDEVALFRLPSRICCCIHLYRCCFHHSEPQCWREICKCCCWTGSPHQKGHHCHGRKG